MKKLSKYQTEILATMMDGHDISVMSGKPRSVCYLNQKLIPMATYRALLEKGAIKKDAEKSSYGRSVYVVVQHPQSLPI